MPTRPRFRATVAGGKTVASGELVSRVLQDVGGLLDRGYTIYLRHGDDPFTVTLRRDPDGGVVIGLPVPVSREPDWLSKVRNVTGHLRGDP